MLMLLVMVLQLMMSMMLRLHVYFVTFGFKMSVDLNADYIPNVVWSKRHVGQ